MPDSLDRDARLLGAIAQGDARALSELYQRHGLTLLNYLLSEIGERQLAEEVLQDIMFAVWNQAEHFRGDSQVKTWLFAIARRQALKARQRRLAPIDEPLEHEIEMQDSENTTERFSEREALIQAIDQLPADQQEALELVFYRGLSGQEAAARIGIPLNTLKSRLQRAKANLRRLMGREGNHERTLS
jgi:RNA polymerase sigma-70 factor, ECF subfamily